MGISSSGRMGNFSRGSFLLGCANLTRSNFDHSTYFKAKNKILQILNID